MSDPVPNRTRILFVDDEPMVLQALQRVLHPMRHTWQMSFVDSGEKGLALLEAEPFDVVVSDMMMPRMNGAQFLAEVQNRHSRAVRLVLSGHVSEELTGQCIGIAHQFIAKPCDPETLRMVIHLASPPSRAGCTDGLQKTVAGLRDFPTLSSTYRELTTLLRTPNVEIEDVAAVIARDVGMTASILRLTNSAFFGLPRHISSVDEALSFLGVETVKHLVLCLDVFGKYKGRNTGRLDLQALWEHSIGVGGASKRIASEIGCSKKVADESFVAGLLHDAGKLLLAFHDPFAYDRILARSEPAVPLWKREHEHFGASHAEVGGYLLGMWGLPPGVIAAVSLHHLPGSIPDRQVGSLAAVHIADAIAKENKAFRQHLFDGTYVRELGFEKTLPEWEAVCSDN